MVIFARYLPFLCQCIAVVAVCSFQYLFHRVIFPLSWYVLVLVVFSVRESFGFLSFFFNPLAVPLFSSSLFIFFELFAFLYFLHSSRCSSPLVLSLPFHFGVTCLFIHSSPHHLRRHLLASLPVVVHPLWTAFYLYVV